MNTKMLSLQENLTKGNLGYLKKMVALKHIGKYNLPCKLQFNI